jgi:hypothetical protein
MNTAEAVAVLFFLIFVAGKGVVLRGVRDTQQQVVGALFWRIIVALQRKASRKMDSAICSTVLF